MPLNVTAYTGAACPLMRISEMHVYMKEKMEAALTLTRGVRTDFCGLCFSDNQQCPTEILVRLESVTNHIHARTNCHRSCVVDCSLQRIPSSPLKANPRLVNDESIDCKTKCGCPLQLEFSMAEKDEKRTKQFIDEICIQVRAWIRYCRC